MNEELRQTLRKTIQDSIRQTKLAALASLVEEIERLKADDAAELPAWDQLFEIVEEHWEAHDEALQALEKVDDVFA